MAGDAAQHQTEPHARRDGLTLAHRDGGEADIVRILQHTDLAAAVEGDVELRGSA